MNKRMEKIAKEAGFEFWEDESWRPSNQMIDWSSDYDRELNQFGDLLLKDVAKWLKVNVHNGDVKAIEMLKAFGVKNKVSAN